MGEGASPSPLSMEELVEKMLLGALDYGITELDFWEMTPAEVRRAVDSKMKVLKIQAQEKASYDYIQAELIIKGIGIVLGSKESFPSVEEVYPSLFTEVIEAQQEKVKQQKMNLSALRFQQFAQSYNNKFKDKEVRK